MYINLNVSVIIQQKPLVLIERKDTVVYGLGEDNFVGRNITIEMLLRSFAGYTLSFIRKSKL